MTKSAAGEFKRFSSPDGTIRWIPADIELRLPDSSAVEGAALQYLVAIPWDDRYLEFVPEAYRAFYRHVLPYLHARTTDVHVALCLPFVRELASVYAEPVDTRVVYLAFILHDSGWGAMSELEIADSLGVQGLALSGAAVGPKARHVELGAEIAERVLAEFPLDPPLTAQQHELILEAILRHDRPDLLVAGAAAPESRLVSDVDHLWSFTHHNFWQDTVRKGVAPPEYLANLAHDLDDYFPSAVGRAKARELLADRRHEVAAWEAWVAAH